MLRQSSVPTATGLPADVVAACVRAVEATDRLIDRHETVRKVSDFDIVELLRGRYGGAWRWTVLGLISAAVLAVVTLAIAGQLDDLYLWIRQHDPFPGDRYYTDVMRDNPWLYLFPAAGLFMLLLLVLPRRLWLNQVIIVMVAGTTGFVGGHVFW